MKISGYKFGHPVFGIDDYYDFKPVINIEQKIENDSLIISSSNFDLGSNSTLKELITNNKASIITEVFCSFTMFRKSYPSKDGINVRIPINQIKNKVETLHLIVANEEMGKYQNSAIKTSLSKQTFYIEQGDVLAILGEESISLDVSTSMDSIVKIRENESGVKNTFSWNESSIIINLPSEQYSKLNKIKASLDYQKILVSSILQSALIHACYKLKLEGQYSEKNWHKALLIHWQNYNEQSKVPATDDIPEFVELLLKKPFGLLINTIEELDNKIRNTQE